MTDAGGTATYSWNARNQLAGITSIGFAASFSYDSFGRRTGKTIQGTTTNFVYDGLNPVQEKAGATVTANLLTGLGIDEFLTRTDGAGTRGLLTDALGSTVALGDGTGTIQTQYTYEPFGYATQAGQASSNSYKYTGREDDGSGLHYYRARYYHPRLQRFISEDPIELFGGDINLYAYVSNAPLIWIDPSGLASKQYDNIGPYDVRIDTGHGKQRHAHIEGGAIKDEVIINQDGTPSHRCEERLPKNKKLLDFLRGKGFAVSIAGALMSIGSGMGDLGDMIGDAIAGPIGGASTAE